MPSKGSLEDTIYGNTNPTGHGVLATTTVDQAGVLDLDLETLNDHEKRWRAPSS
jgi:hypothetical protein